ncbi:MAG: CRTAC1 family protein [Acidobacteriota bacterium]
MDRTAAVGLDFVHHNGMSGDLFFSEILGPGSALFDADNDGDLDLYLVQGQMLGAAKTLADAVIPWKGEESPSDRLFRNELEAGALRFTDITSTSGLVSAEYGMGVAAGDIDNDGWTDLYVTNFGANRLWRNQGLDEQGQVTFRDLTAETGTGDERWSTSAAFLDFDRDGWLDLYVVNYTDFRLTNHQTCFTDLGRTDYCGPKTYRPETDRLFRNLGPGPDGHVEFADVSAEAGLLAAPGPGLGVITVDVDGDGWLDIYVANDQARNHLWINRGVAGSAPTLFREEALERGCAVDSQGRVQASMGVEAGDVDRDGSPDLFMTHLLREVNTLYLNDGRGRFDDRSAASGLAGPSIGMTGFGAAMLDIEGDGWLDVLTVNGEVRIIKAQRLAGDPLPLRQPNQLFLNREGRFVDVSDRVPALTVAGVSRGAAVGDVDNDGDPDVVVNNNSEAVQLLINPRDGGGAHWLGLRLVTETGRDALGALVTLTRENEPPLIRWSRTDSSFLVARDPRVVFGLGSNPAVDRVVVRWPNGTHEVFDQLEVDCYQTLRAGDGRPIAELSG